jgi:hypothetical protein
MKQTESTRATLGRRSFFAGLVSGLGVAALALGGRKALAGRSRPARKGEAGPVLYRRSAEAERYLKTLY